MKILKIIPAFLLLLSPSVIHAQSLEKAIRGSWENKIKKDGKELTQLLLVSGSFYSLTEYATADGDFISTRGGSWQLEGEKLLMTLEFDTKDAEKVGTNETAQLKLKGKGLQLKSEELGNADWKQLDKGMTTPLTNPWLITGRERNGEITRRTGDSPRKTMKILTGNHFQWIAFNTATGEFFGTGGGSYTAENGIYTENIEFFSRDKNRVGASLTFNFEVEGEDWHHKGKSSKGDPMYEIWSVRDLPTE